MKQLLTSLWIWTDSTIYPWLHAVLNAMIALLILLIASSYEVKAQGVIPTKGTDFWIGVPYHEPVSTKRCDVFITSDVNTSGTISIPAQGWSQNFTVVANVTTTITLPLPLAEHIGSDIIQNKGVQVLSNDTVNVFAVVIQQYSADASVIYPKSSLGTDYRITSYRGVQNSSYPNLKSDFQIVATEDGTQIQIIPTVATAAGRPANVPYLVNLNKGQSYQVMAASAAGDFTGTKITGTDSSGSCRPFAVFSGTNCAYVPNTCTACDILYDQALPVKAWGKTYHVVPFGNTQYTLKILAEQNGTSYTMNGVPTPLNAGQFIEINNITGTRCIQSNKPISVTQFMQGNNCGGSGDPSMLYLNAEEQKIDRVTFSTVTSTIITTHKVNVIMKSTHISQLKLDGISVPASSFTSMSYCNTNSYANLSLTPGSHTLSSDSGFTAYVYGSGGYESYGYSVGSFSKSQPIQVDSILCTTDTVVIGSTQPMFGPWWSTLSNPTDTIGLGQVLVLVPPILPNIYVVHGNEYISGCESAFYFNVTVPAAPSVWTSQTSTTACQGQLVQLNAGTTPASASFQYTWTPAAGLNSALIPNPVLTATTSGWYVVKVSSIGGCAPDVYDSIYVSVFSAALPVVSAGPDQLICAGDTINITATGGVTYVWSTGATGASVNFNPIITTNYIVYATDANGCGNSDTVKVKVNPLPVANAGFDRAICENSATTLSATGGISYLWNPGNISGNNIIVLPPVTTMYTVQVTDLNGCKNIDSVLVTIHPVAQANAGIDQDICMGDSAILIASGGTIYFWVINASTSNSIVVSPAASTNFVVIVNNVYNCIGRDTVRVNVHALPAINAGINQQVCQGDSVVLSVSGGLTCLWTPGGDSSRVITVVPSGSTSYVATVTDSMGCKNADTVRVIVYSLPNVNLGADVSICYGDSILLSSTMPGQSYVWYPMLSNTNAIWVSPLTNAYYSLAITDTNSCVNSDTIQVIVHPKVIADAGPDSISSCISLNTTLTVSGGQNYIWSPGGFTTDTIVVSPALSTLYTVIVSDAFGCTGMDSVQLFIQPFITGTSTSSAICLNDSITLIGSNAVNYLWLPGGVTDSSYVVAPTQSGYYVVYMELSNGCLVYDTTNIIVQPLPLADAGPDQEICMGQAALLNASGGTSYFWLNTGMPLSSIAVAPVNSGYYVVNVKDNNGCQLLDSAYVLVFPLPIVNAGPDDVICKGDSVLLQATGGVSYTWFPGGVSGPAIYFQPLAITNYLVVATDSNGCVNRDSVQVIPIEDPEVNFTVSTPVCQEDNLVFTNTSSVSIGSIVKSEWAFGDGGTSTSIDPSHPYIAPGQYNISLIVVSDNGCTDSLFTSIYINEKPAPHFTAQNECAEQLVSFIDASTIGTGSIQQWLWNYGDGYLGLGSSSQHVYAQAGWYSVSLTTISDSGCSQTILMPNALEIYPLPIAHFSASPDEATIFTPQIQFTDESIGGALWNWHFADNTGTSQLQNPMYTYSDTGRFNVELIVTSIHGCLDTAYHEIYISPGFTLYIPNAFTPNDDGKNDFFVPSGIGYSVMRLFIFNRWGDEIYSTEDITKGWDGKDRKHQQICEEGTYIYVVKIVDFKNTPHEYNGVVSLLK